MRELAQEGRKLDQFGLVCGQVWTASRAGSFEPRDSLASVYMHRLRPAQARVLTGYSAADLPGDLLELPPGHAYTRSTAGDLGPVVIPRMTRADAALVAELLGGAPAPSPAPAPLAERPIGFRPEGAFGGTGRAPRYGRQDAANLSPAEAGLVAAFLGGTSPSDLAAKLAGGKKSGDTYTQAACRVADVLRRALGGQAVKDAA